MSTSWFCLHTLCNNCMKYYTWSSWSYFIFEHQLVLSSYSLLQLHGILYIQFLVMFSLNGGFILLIYLYKSAFEYHSGIEQTVYSLVFLYQNNEIVHLLVVAVDIIFVVFSLEFVHYIGHLLFVPVLITIVTSTREHRHWVLWENYLQNYNICDHSLD